MATAEARLGQRFRATIALSAPESQISWEHLTLNVSVHGEATSLGKELGVFLSL